MKSWCLLLSLIMAAPSVAAAQQALPVATTTYEIGGPFNLATHRGSRLGDSDLRGQPYALFFGFTHCPEVCPTALFELTGALATLGPDAERLSVLFVTVDPERDTQAHLAEYLSSFDERIVGLRGSEAETATVARSFRATYRKVPLDGDEYTMDHTAVIYLMDAQGRFFDKVDYRESHEVLVAKLRQLLDTNR